jgi:hypothetical protein
VFADEYDRQDADYQDLRKWADLTGADVYFLQEVTSPAALDEVFPLSAGWQYCISGQFALNEGQTTPGPSCFKAGETPTKPQAATRTQYTAVAIRSTGSTSIISAQDLSELNVKTIDNGITRDVRWGLDVTLSINTTPMRFLVVHLKSGCFDEFIDRKTWLTDPTGLTPASDACVTKGRQLFFLRRWIEQREAAGDLWGIVGDMNRRIDAGAGYFPDEIWRALSGYSPDNKGDDLDGRADITIYREPYKEPSPCWKEFSNPRPATLKESDSYNLLPIEFFIFGTSLAAHIAPGSGHHVPWPSPSATDPERLSDHCPSYVELK